MDHLILPCFVEAGALAVNGSHALEDELILLKVKGSSVPDPKLIISDPDPQIESQEFRIRILL